MSVVTPLYTSALTANQGVLFTDLFDGIDALLLALAIPGLVEQRVVRWFFGGRPAIEGADFFVWYRLNEGAIDKADGPVRYGNKINPAFTINVETRYAGGKSQVDNPRIARHFTNYWKIINSFQNSMLFPAYNAADNDADPWIPPQPTTGYPPLTVEPMLVTLMPGGDKTQKEEWTISSALQVVLPCVLKLTI